MALAFMGMAGAGLFFPLFFQLVMGVSAAHSGVLTGPMMVGVVVSSVVNGRVLLRSGRYKRTQIVRLAAAVAAFAALAWGIATAQSFAVIEPAIVRARPRAWARHAQHDDRGAERAADRPSRRRHRDARLLPLAGRARSAWPAPARSSPSNCTRRAPPRQGRPR